MIISVFGPCGIVTATSCHDTYFDLFEKEEESYVRLIGIEGLPHVFTFFGKYALVYNCLNQSEYDVQIPYCFSLLANKWDTAPEPMVFMPYLKKLIVDNHIQIIGVVSAYFEEKDGKQYPYVYHILGEEIRRVNVSDVGNIIYNCICLEKEPIIGRLLRQVKLRNGDVWEEQEDCRFRYDLFSVSKSVDFCVFAIKTNHYVNSKDVNYCTPLCMDITVVTPNSIDVVQKKY